MLLDDFLQCVNNNTFIEILEVEKSISMWNGRLEDLYKTDIYESIKDRCIAKKGAEIRNDTIDNFLPFDYKNIDYILNGKDAHEELLSYLFIEIN